MKITYLSDSIPDYAILESYLKKGKFGKLHDERAYLAHITPSSAMQNLASQLIAKLNASDEQRAKLLPDEIVLPTRYESPIQFQIVDDLVKQIKATVTDHGIETENFPLYATIPTGLINAQAIRLEGATKDFLLFDSQIFTYCNLFAKAFAICLPIEIDEEDGGIRISMDSSNVVAHLGKDQDGIDRLHELLFVLYESANPSLVRPYLPEATYLQLGDFLRRGMELFLVAHEFGHVYAGHLENFLPRNAIENLEETTSSSHKIEHEADAIGLILTLAAQRAAGLDLAMSYIGAHLFFEALDLQKRYDFSRENGIESEYQSLSNDTHPSNQMRIEFLKTVLAEIAPKELTQSAISLAENYSNVIAILWNEIKKKIPK